MKIINGSNIMQKRDYALHLAFAWTRSPSSKIAKTLLQFCKRSDLEVYNKPSNVAFMESWTWKIPFDHWHK